MPVSGTWRGPSQLHPLLPSPSPCRSVLRAQLETTFFNGTYDWGPNSGNKIATERLLVYTERLAPKIPVTVMEAIFFTKPKPNQLPESPFSPVEETVLLLLLNFGGCWSSPGGLS